MRLTTVLLGFILSLFTFTAMAGSDHDHGHSHNYTPVSQDKAKTNATEIVAALVARNKIDKTWKSIAASTVEKVTAQDNPEWLVVFVDKSITDESKQKLYVFLTLGGDYIAANFTGK